MSRWLLFPILLATQWWASGCDPNPAEPVVDPPSFHVGQRWVYTYDAVMQDSLGGILNAYHDSIEVRVAAVGDTVLGMSGLVRMEARSLPPFFFPGPWPGIESVWYQATSTSLIEVAYRNPGAVPVVVLSVGDRTRKLAFGSFFEPLRSVRMEASSDTTQLRDEPRIVLKYPLKKGAAWDAFHVPFLQTREVVAIEKIRSLGRDLSTARIRTTIPEFSPGIEWDDWVSPIGLVRRFIKVTLEMTDENMNFLGKFTSTETLELVAM
ncbi:MAG: hypothetical protein AABY75_00795 [Bacteroidota bacterium]